MVAFDSPDAVALLRQWLQGPLLQSGPSTPPTSGLSAEPRPAAAVSVELLGLTRFALGTLPPGQLVLAVQAGRAQPVRCVLVPISVAASTLPAPPEAKALPVPTRPLPPNEASAPPECRTTSWLRQLHGVLKENLENPAFGVVQLADCLAMTPKSLLRKMQAVLGTAPKEYMQHHRLGRAAQLLADGYRVGEVSDLTGFSSATHFGQCFKKAYGVSPGQYALQHSAVGGTHQSRRLVAVK